MIYFVVAKRDQGTFDTYFKESVKEIDSVTVEVSGEETVCYKYNFGIENILKSYAVTDEDVVIFIHEDVKILDHFFKEKIDKVFSEKKDVGILGVIGTDKLVELGGWWMTNSENLHGNIIQEINKNETHLVKGSIGYFDKVVAIDGLMIAVRMKVLKDGMRFDEKFESTFDFYEINFCLDLLLKTDWKVAIAPILIQHRSPGLGSLSQNWKDARKKMVEKYKNIGLIFPITVDKIQEFKNANSGINKA